MLVSRVLFRGFLQLNRLLSNSPRVAISRLFVPLLLIVSGLFLQTVFASAPHNSGILGGPLLRLADPEKEALLVARSIPSDLSVSDSAKLSAGFIFADQASLVALGPREEAPLKGVADGGGRSGLSTLSTSHFSDESPLFEGYYAAPTTGWNWGVAHGEDNNAVDFANGCGTRVYASASGVVSGSTGLGYNGGYGNMILIEHPNNTRTLYAHLADILVSAGGYVAQGDAIGLMGKSGNVHPVGALGTGCHLHFGIEGAVNVFVK